MLQSKLKDQIKKWDNLFSDNSDLIFLGNDFKDIEKASEKNKTAIFFGFQKENVKYLIYHHFCSELFLKHLEQPYPKENS